MPNHVTCTWTGASGMKYVYLVYAYPFLEPPEIATNEPGNFIYAKKDPQGRWTPIYVGDGDLTQVAVFDPKKIQCIMSKGATHVHLHANFEKGSRVAEVKDLLANYPPAYAPDGCTEQEGG